jgi:GIY-YIG catalytic domain-containing protein
VPPVQLRLFPVSKPLQERLGNEFFRRVPRQPGVYQMRGPSDRLLYVGQSKNLRQRLLSYKNAHPDRVSPKVTRLIHSVDAIEYELLATAEDARLKENDLLRNLRPPFNVANTYPKAYSFVTIQKKERTLVLSRGNQPVEELQNFGAFKGRAVAAFGAVLRLLWGVLHQPHAPSEFPLLLLRAAPPRQYTVDFAGCAAALDEWHGLLAAFFTGASSQLLSALQRDLPAGAHLSRFQLNYVQFDLDLLEEFFETGPKRNFELWLKHSLPTPLILQEELDDLMVYRARR